ncbi:Crp/Fnr family transcriptional regulator [Treponema brennaborense]|uniref:Transcriptional regulator, Crp/Fnr family n=1 Tax=Treponema brennaborense (strain DSM 12168 / CIP 105900 / DD5/3) TaxID=906968 RepID=F4LNP9_TREBD|nr:cyclic nucleotide-binding domain-containing protein [Treponema brennaborense]AEE16884.1 putative transcriptional regulator, Crp/Fnr family [Treponema brennaborense DSM 12168]
MLQLSFVNFRKDSFILVEGNPCGDRFFIIRSGSVRCVKERAVVQSATFGPGDFIGVVPCLSGHAQTESVIAVTDVVVIAVNRNQYPDLIQQNTPVAMKIIRTFANRMRIMNEVLTQLTFKGVAVVSPEQLFAIASYYEKEGKINLAVYGYYQYLKACPSGVNAVRAKDRFIALKPRSRAVHFEPNQELIREYPKDTMIFSECQSGHDMYIIQEGQVKITKVVDNNEVILAVLKKGDFFGEMALLEDKPRSASAIAHEACRLMVVNRKNFDQMVASQPQLVSRLTITLSERLWAMERQLTNTEISDPVFKMVDMLALQIEKAKIAVDSPVKVSFTFDLSPEDIADMCGISHDMQGMAINRFMDTAPVRRDGRKLLVTDCLEVIKSAAVHRKQKH